MYCLNYNCMYSPTEWSFMSICASERKRNNNILLQLPRSTSETTNDTHRATGSKFEALCVSRSKLKFGPKSRMWLEPCLKGCVPLQHERFKISKRDVFTHKRFIDVPAQKRNALAWVTGTRCKTETSKNWGDVRENWQPQMAGDPGEFWIWICF